MSDFVMFTLSHRQNNQIEQKKTNFKLQKIHSRIFECVHNKIHPFFGHQRVLHQGLRKGKKYREMPIRGTKKRVFLNVAVEFVYFLKLNFQTQSMVSWYNLLLYTREVSNK